MIGASLKAAEVVKKKAVNPRVHIAPSGSKYQSDHDLTPDERKKIDAYDLSQSGTAKVGGKFDPTIKAEPQPKGGLFAKNETATVEGQAEAKKYAKSKGVNLEPGQRDAMQRKAIGNIAAAKAGDLLEPITGPLSDILAKIGVNVDPVLGAAEKAMPGSAKGAIKSGLEGVVTGPISSVTSAGILTAPDAKIGERVGAGLELARDAALANTHIILPKLGGALRNLIKGTEKAAVLEKGAFVPKEDPAYFSPGTLEDAGVKVKTKTKGTQNTPKPPEVPQTGTQATEAGNVEGQTGVSHAEVDKIRENLGWAPRTPTEAKPDAQLIADSKKLAGKESAIAEKVIGDPKATLADEEAIAVGQRLNGLIEKMKGAKKAGDGEAFDLADAEAQRLADALDESGSRQGRDFRARQFLMSQQTDPWIVARKLRKQGVNEKRIAVVTKQLEDANAKVGEQQALIEQLQKAASEADAREILTKAARTKRQVNREAIIKEIDDLWKELPAATAKLSAGIDPEAAKVFGKLVVRHIELGAATVDDAIRTVIEEAAKRGHSVSNLDIYQGVRENAGVPKTVDEAKRMIARNKAELTKLAQKNVEGAAVPTKEAKRIADIEAQTADLENQLKTGAFKKSAKVEKVRSKRLELEEMRLKQLRAEVQGVIKAAEPKSVIGKVNEFARESQLANPIARIMDVSANTVKLAAHVAQNPLRSLISTIVTPKTIGRERFSLTPSRFKNIFENAPSRWKSELKGVLKGADFETIEKYGHPGGWFSRLAGASDVVFKDIYARLAYDDFALGAAKSMKLKGEAFKTYRMDAFKQLVRESASGPLSQEQVLIARASAQDWAARQTFNIDNVASRSVASLKEGVGARLDKEFGRNAGDGWRLAMDSVFRFSKVIGNVALEKFNYMGEGLAEAAVRGVGAKARHGMIPVKDARLISDLAAKGLTGLAAIQAGKAAYPWIQSQDWIKGEIVETEGGTKFVKWTVLPNVAGGLDAEQLGGLLSPMLYGATQRMIDESKLTAKQKEQLWTTYAQGQITNQPLSSGVRMLGDIADPKGKTPAQIGANLAARAIIPSGVNEIGQRMDKMRNGVELRKAKTPLEEFIKRLPIYRESLPSNEKKTSR